MMRERKMLGAKQTFAVWLLCLFSFTRTGASVVTLGTGPYSPHMGFKTVPEGCVSSVQRYLKRPEARFKTDKCSCSLWCVIYYLSNFWFSSYETNCKWPPHNLLEGMISHKSGWCWLVQPPWCSVHYKVYISFVRLFAKQGMCSKVRRSCQKRLKLEWLQWQPASILYISPIASTVWIVFATVERLCGDKSWVHFKQSQACLFTSNQWIKFSSKELKVLSSALTQFIVPCRRLVKVQPIRKFIRPKVLHVLIVRSSFRAKHHVVVQYMARWMKYPLPPPPSGPPPLDLCLQVEQGHKEISPQWSAVDPEMGTGREKIRNTRRPQKFHSRPIAATEFKQEAVLKATAVRSSLPVMSSVLPCPYLPQVMPPHLADCFPPFLCAIKPLSVPQVHSRSLGQIGQSDVITAIGRTRIEDEKKTLEKQFLQTCEIWRSDKTFYWQNFRITCQLQQGVV